jgi:hypothetical protein
MEQQFQLNKLFETYSNLVTNNYKVALADLMETGGKYTPPTLDFTNTSLMEAAEHIQACSTYHSTVSQLASFARSAFTLSEGLYKQKFRKALGEAEGSNAAAREAFATAATELEHDQVLFYQSAMILFDSLEKSARIAADSSRKMAELIQSQHISEVGNKY